MPDPIPFAEFDRPAIERHRGEVLRALQAALIKFEIDRAVNPSMGLEQSAIRVLRTLGGFGIELRRRRVQP